ncbi:MAG: S8 family serine peptidase, partial [Candidatus Thermoplasmatota archaeon]|nr:S8 family serine peptidase [Candidatus Thermoplasmatota archaeon]
MGSDTPQSSGFTGSGILAEVIDDGIDLTHTDLGQVLFTDFAPVANSHGTCTSGIMFGDGTGDINALGVLYEAIGVFGDWGNGNALGISNLWAGTFASGNAGQNGVVQTNSWWNGAAMDGEYDAMSNEIDQAIVDNPKILTHWAIGNSNNGEAEGLMSAESISKNNMAVGAIFHEDTASTADDNWHSAGAGMTPSRGPAADGRAKPDMLACFDWIYTVDQMGGAGYTGTNYYDDFGGTSGATPTVAGMSGLAYEMYQENYFDNNPTGEWPYSSTIKALMIADAYQYPMTGGNLITRNVQGWGSPDMQNMYNLGADYHVIEEYPQALSGGDSWSRGVFSDGINPLKITLAWVDPAAPDTTIAGRALINNLDLHVISPSGTQYWGNNGLGIALYNSPGTGAQRWSTTSSYRDDLNNVENVFILAPEVGVWTVEVQGRSGDVAQGPQDFSVVASGAAGISSMGTIDLDLAVYMLEDTATITVTDLDLDTDSGTIQTVNVNVDSTTEPAGETVLLTETAVDSATFEGSLTLSATNGAGILQVSHGDLVTATYNDADDGTGSSAVVTDTATIDGMPPGPPTGLTVEWYGLVQAPIYTETFEGDGTPTFAELGWTTGGASNDWQIGTPAGLGTPPDPSGAYAGSFSIGNDLTGLGTYPGEYENSLAVNSNFIYSPAINCVGFSSVQLQFMKFLGVETSTYDHVYIEVATSTSGPWTQIWTNGGTISDASWSSVSYDISAVADNQLVVYVRFELGATDGSDTYCGWNIDNLELVGLTSGTQHNTLNWTLSSDDGAGSNDVNHYNIYRSTLQTGPWDGGTLIDTVSKGVATYVDPDRGEFDGTNWWYVVRAVDNIGYIDSNTNAVPEIPLINVAPSVPNSPTPANGAIGVSVDPTLSVRVADPNGDQMTVRFYDASGPTLIGTNFNVPSGTFTNMPWNGLFPTTAYSWYVTVDDGEFVTQSPTWSFTTVDMTPPGPPADLTVDWWGGGTQVLYNEGFEGDGTPTLGELGWITGGASTDWQVATPTGLGGEHGNPDP